MVFCKRSEFRRCRDIRESGTPNETFEARLVLGAFSALQMTHSARGFMYWLRNLGCALGFGFRVSGSGFRVEVRYGFRRACT